MIEEPAFAEPVLTLDVVKLAWCDVLDGQEHTWGWDDLPGYEIRLTSFGDWIELAEADGTPIAEVPLVSTRCHYGGQRWWFACPRPSCDRRARKIYWDGTRPWGCRPCLGLRYESQREREMERAARRARKIKQRLGGTRNLLEPLPPKLALRHWRTHDDLVRQYEEACAEFRRLYQAKVG